MRLSQADLTQSDLLRTIIADYLALLVWMKTKDGRKGRNRPKPLREVIGKHKQQKEIVGFDSPEEFERARQAIISEVAHG